MIADRANVLSVLKKYDYIFIFFWQNQYVLMNFCTFFSFINFPTHVIERKTELWCLKLQAAANYRLE